MSRDTLRGGPTGECASLLAATARSMNSRRRTAACECRPLRAAEAVLDT